MSRLTRRSFLASTAAAGPTAGLTGFAGFGVHAAEPLVRGTPNADTLGWAEADITTDKPVHLTGLGNTVRIADSAKDPLTATVLASTDAARCLR